jgi:ribonuclease HI
VFSKRPQIDIYTDGACIGNPGPGGYGAVLVSGNRRKELSRGFRLTTNNRMELMAVIAALETVNQESDVRVFTDSQYVRNGITSWVRTWMKNGWRTSAKKPVKNRDLWERLMDLGDRPKIEWKWIKGHAGHRENERCDRLANEASRAGRLAEDKGYF